MKLLRLARRAWDVLAVCDQRGHCQVVRFLEDLQGLEGKAARNMLAILRRTVSVSGPHMGERLCKSLGDGVYEFRRQPKGKKLRILWFYGGTAVIVCTAAFKKAERTPQVQLDRARFLRKQYWIARSRNEIEIIDSKEESLEP
jgi:phage-related protein